MTDFIKYFQIYDHIWDFDYSQEQIMEEKWQYISKIIPKDVKTIIDIGCGEGFFTSRMAQNYQVIGNDINEKNLVKLQCPTLNCFAHEIDLEPESIDLIFSSEMLEHLPDENTLLKTVQKFKTISRKYILITVPNQQNLNNNSLKCGRCGHIFNSSFHNFSFDRKKLESLFPGFRTIHFDTIGPVDRPYKHNWLLYIRNNLANNWALPNRYTTCPNCANSKDFVHKKNILSKLCHLTNFLIAKKRKAWIIILLAKM